MSPSGDVADLIPRSDPRCLSVRLPRCPLWICQSRGLKISSSVLALSLYNTTRSAAKCGDSQSVSLHSAPLDSEQDEK